MQAAIQRAFILRLHKLVRFEGRGDHGAVQAVHHVRQKAALDEVDLADAAEQGANLLRLRVANAAEQLHFLFNRVVNHFRVAYQLIVAHVRGASMRARAVQRAGGLAQAALQLAYILIHPAHAYAQAGGE